MRESIYAPWYVIAWRLVWIIPLFAARVLFVILVAIYQLDTSQGRYAWKDTR